MHTTRLNLLIQGSFVHSHIQVVAHHYQRISSSQYLCQMKVQSQQRYSNALTQRRIPHSHITVHQFKYPESIVMLTLTKMKTIHDFTHGFAYIFQSTLVSTHSISKMIFKACNSDDYIGTII